MTSRDEQQSDNRLFREAMAERMKKGIWIGVIGTIVVLGAIGFIIYKACQ